jgi:hypothetical protein
MPVMKVFNVLFCLVIILPVLSGLGLVQNGEFISFYVALLLTLLVGVYKFIRAVIERLGD